VRLGTLGFVVFSAARQTNATKGKKHDKENKPVEEDVRS